MATIRIGIIETSPKVYRLTFNGNILGDSRGYAKSEAINQAKIAVKHHANDGHWEYDKWVEDTYILEIKER